MADIDNIINWDDAQRENARIKQQQLLEQQKQVELFLEENHELADGRDLQYWMDATGKDIEWILENGKGINDYLISILNNGGTLDDVWRFTPPIVEEEDYDEEEDDEF